MLITLYEERPRLWDVDHKDYMNRDNFYLGLSFTFVVQTSYYHTQSSYFFGFLLVERHVLIHLHALRVALGTRKCKHLSPDFFGSQFIIKRMRNSLVFRNNVSSFSHRGSKRFCSFPSNLATLGNITRNNVYATMFPSLTRP